VRHSIIGRVLRDADCRDLTLVADGRITCRTAERARWLGLLALSVLLVLRLDRDLATPSFRQHSHARWRQSAP
jgi:hypothetical protein